MVLMLPIARWYLRALDPSPFSLAAAAAVSYILNLSIITSRSLEEDAGGGRGERLDALLAGGVAFTGGFSSSSSTPPVSS